jgi:hypothetical protein
MAPNYIKIDLRIGLRNDPLTKLGIFCISLFVLPSAFISAAPSGRNYVKFYFEGL